MKVYTKTGDDGSTGLWGGQRVGKDSPRIEACGSIDELNSVIGLAAAPCEHDELSASLYSVQDRLFELGAELCTPPGTDPPANTSGQVPWIEDAHVHEIESQIDAVTSQLPALTQFIQPGGGELAAQLHHARTVCRRAERVCVTLSSQAPVRPVVLIYLNRLSDLLFVMARLANQLQSVPQAVWTGRQTPADR